MAGSHNVGRKQHITSGCPVFCTAEVPAETLTQFFKDALAVHELANEGADNLGVLVNTTDVSSITTPTRPPVPPPSSYPFKGWTVDQIWDFAKTKLATEQVADIETTALAILDERTLQDQTSLLVMHRELEGGLLTVRADFASTLVRLNVVNLGIGGQDHFETPNPDGVIRYGDE
ncbi:hypothetical protein B0A50_04694 [Salinomyces thailandicus]|uniref:Uncharacterized protein n=1 Tax=Salinomyces thailandicus TaxID=706561 RepID=A0A4U0TX71_9PEZI|nr:hypothetical protein B0A50_04694 [Salinomyces thailandica]